MNQLIISQDTQAIIESVPELVKLKNKTILITGANGFIPAYMIETFTLLNEKYDFKITVYALARNKIKVEKRFSNYLNNNWLKFIIQDVNDEIHITKPIHFIIHAASQASPKFYKKDPVGTLLANTKGTYNILELARSHTKDIEGILFFSSAEIYGHVNEKIRKVTENDIGVLDCCSLRACYAESKRMGETMCVSWLKQYNLPCKIIRIFHTYGPGMDLNDGRVFADFVKNVVEGSSIEMKSDGSAIRAYCYLSDTVAAAFKILLCGESGTAYNVGNEEAEISVYELARLLSKLSKNTALDISMLPNNESCMPISISKIVPNTRKLRDLGWFPRQNISDGFKRTIEFYSNTSRSISN